MAGGVRREIEVDLRRATSRHRQEVSSMPSRRSEGSTSSAGHMARGRPRQGYISRGTRRYSFLPKPQDGRAPPNLIITDSPYSAASRSRTEQAAKLTSACIPFSSAGPISSCPVRLDSDRRHAGPGAQPCRPTEFGPRRAHHRGRSRLVLALCLPVALYSTRFFPRPLGATHI